MITEIALLTIDPARGDAFEAAVASSAPIFQAAPGCHGMTLEREIEDPAHYRLLVTWDTLEAHIVDFRASPGFQQWRAIAGPFFTAPPVVVHGKAAIRFF